MPDRVTDIHSWDPSGPRGSTKYTFLQTMWFKDNLQTNAVLLFYISVTRIEVRSC